MDDADSLVVLHVARKLLLGFQDQFLLLLQLLEDVGQVVDVVHADLEVLRASHVDDSAPWNDKASSHHRMLP